MDSLGRRAFGTELAGAPIGSLRQETVPSPLSRGGWHVAAAVGDGLTYRLGPDHLAHAKYLCADFLLDGNQLVVFQLRLHEEGSDRTFCLSFGLLAQCSARMRLPLWAVKQNRWLLNREGAWLKPLCGADPVDPARVDRIDFVVKQMPDGRVRWCMTPLVATVGEPDRITVPLLPKGRLLDELGQSSLHDWPTKTRSVDDLTSRLRELIHTFHSPQWPDSYSASGGWSERRVDGTGFFRTRHDGTRWWLVDPDGRPFWSSGVDCVQPVIETASAGLESALTWIPQPADGYADAVSEHSINYLAANMIRAFGPGEWRTKWEQLALDALRQIGFNTIGNWSDWPLAGRAGMPYVRQLHWNPRHTPTVFRDFPDVFHPAFAADAGAFAAQLHTTAGDPAMIGYFLMNEPTWGFARHTPAEGMLHTTPRCESRGALAEFLRARYRDDTGLASAWGMNTSLAHIAEGHWSEPFTLQARHDLTEFSTLMVTRLYDGISTACRTADPNHLNLGTRYYTIPPDWVLAGARTFDVCSLNCYRDRVPEAELAAISAALDRPILIGEFHFGALDVGLPATGVGPHVADQAARGHAFRFYVEHAAAQPWCIGTHYFTMYDQSALGRYDGENFNIGFFDVCHRPYQPLVAAARRTHERLYRVAAGLLSPVVIPPRAQRE